MSNRKVRILHFSIANTKSGVTQYIMNHWQFIDRTKFHFDFVTFSKKLDYEEELIAGGSKVYYVNTYAEQNEKQFCQEVRDILKNGYDIVHLHTSNWSSFMLERLAREANISKIIIHAHNSDVHNAYGKSREEARKKHFLIREQLNTSTATDYWACSDLAAEWLYGDKIPKEKIVIMKNAIDIEKFLFNISLREQWRKKLGMESNFVIGHIGRFEYQKNHEFIIKVFAKLCRKIPDARLVLVGDGSLRSKIEETARAYGIERKVLFPGKQEEVEKWYQVMDVFVLPSHFEGLPLSLVEAQASGLSCLVSEHVSEEVKLSEKIRFLKLDEELWYIELMKLHNRDKETRDNMKQTLSDAGYDLINEVRQLEKMYLEFSK